MKNKKNIIWLKLLLKAAKAIIFIRLTGDFFFYDQISHGVGIEIFLLFLVVLIIILECIIYIYEKKNKK